MNVYVPVREFHDHYGDDIAAQPAGKDAENARNIAFIDLLSYRGSRGRRR